MLFIGLVPHIAGFDPLLLIQFREVYITFHIGMDPCEVEFFDRVVLQSLAEHLAATDDEDLLFARLLCVFQGFFQGMKNDRSGCLVFPIASDHEIHPLFQWPES